MPSLTPPKIIIITNISRRYTCKFILTSGSMEYGLPIVSQPQNTVGQGVKVLKDYESI